MAGPQLYAAYLGGIMPGNRMGEDHEVVLVVADDGTEARQRARSKWGGLGRAHVDALQCVEMVDGFAVRLEPAGDGDRLLLEGYDADTEQDGA
ncbi:MAG: DUF1543 domain-containing protein [Acidimicrobiales bacterium]|nr:DUF1543 domain-containing protein [Acidimicrobiales bacterium]